MTSFSITDPVAFVTVTIFSKTSREELRSPALIPLFGDVRFFISCRVLLTVSWILNSSRVSFAMIASNYLNVWKYTLVERLFQTIWWHILWKIIPIPSQLGDIYSERLSQYPVNKVTYTPKDYPSPQSIRWHIHMKDYLSPQ